MVAFGAGLLLRAAGSKKKKRDENFNKPMGHAGKLAHTFAGVATGFWEASVFLSEDAFLAPEG